MDLLKDNIYCISLKEKQYRRDNVLENFPYNLHFLNAYDTRGSKISLYKELIDKKSWKQLEKTNIKKERNYHHNLTNGAVGCFLSHIEILKKIVKKGKPYSIVLEDDCESKIENLDEYLKYVIYNLPKDCHVLFLDYFSIRYDPGNSDIINEEFIRPRNRYNFKLYLTNCLLITYEGAKKILENFTKVKIQYDSFLSKLFRDHKINIYLTKNKFFKQSDHSSDIQNVGNVLYPKVFDYNKI